MEFKNRGRTRISGFFFLLIDTDQDIGVTDNHLFLEQVEKKVLARKYCTEFSRIGIGSI